MPVAVTLVPLIEWPALQPRGTVLFVREDGVDENFGIIQAVPAIDVDGDGELDVVAGVANSAFGSVDRIEAWNLDGTRIASFASEDSLGGTGFFSREWIEAVGDVACIAGAAEIAAELVVLSGATGAPLIARQQDERAGVESAGDVDGDGRGDLVVISWRGAIVPSGYDLGELRRILFPCPYYHRAGGVGDLDGDGVADLTVCEARADEFDYDPSWLRTPRRSRVTVWSGVHFTSRSEPLEIR